MAESHVIERPFIGYVYCATNSKNGKRYVGITIQGVQARWRYHLKQARRGLGTTLHDAIRKHGSEVFVVEQLASASSHKEMISLEQRFISELGCFVPKGYNRTLGGIGSQGAKFPAATRARMAASAVSRWSDAAVKEKHKQARLDAWARDPDRKLKARVRFVGDFGKTVRALQPTVLSAETIAKLNRARKAYWQTSGARARQSKISSEAWADPVKREKIQKALKISMQTDDFRSQAAERAKILWADQEFRKKVSEAHKRRWQERERKTAADLTV